MRLIDQFNMTDPDFFKDIHGNAQALEAVRKIEERRVALARKLEAHCQKHRAQWIVREATRLHAKQAPQMQYAVPKPRNVLTHQLLWNHHILQARQNVDLRIEERKQALNTSARRMQHNAVAIPANQEHQTLARQRLDQEVKEIHQSTHRQRMDLYRSFEENKLLRVETARKINSQNPERDVYAAYKQQDREILASKEHQLKQVYEKYGFNYANEQFALTQKYNQKL